MKIDFSKKHKEKIYKDLNAVLYKEYNQGIDDLRRSLDIEYKGLLDDILEGAWQDGGAKQLRKIIDTIMKILANSQKELNKPELPNNVKPVRFNKPFRPVYKKKRYVDRNQIKMKFID